jgi:hypothetical protein
MASKRVNLSLSPTKRRAKQQQDGAIFYILPDSFQVIYFQNRRSALCAAVSLYLVVIGVFVGIFVGNYNAVTKSSFLSASGSSWSSDCSAREPVSQEFLLTDSGYWSNQKSFEYHTALMSFIIPQGYQQGGEGFKNALGYFTDVLEDLQNMSTRMDWVSQLSLMSSKKWIHGDTGIQMRYLANPQNILSFPSSGEEVYQLSFETANGSSSTCGSPVLSVNGAYLTVTWYNPSTSCEIFGNMSNLSFYSFKVDVRSSMIATAINSGLMNYTDLGEVMAYDFHTMEEKMLRCDPHYPGMQVLNCEEVEGTCFLEVYQNGWYHIKPTVWHFCQYYTDMCNSTCTCTKEEDVSDEMCMYNGFVLELEVLDSNFSATGYKMAVQFNADFNFALNDYSYMPMFPHCSSEALVPSKMLNAISSKSVDTGAVETYFECTRTPAYGFIYGLSTSLSVVSGIYALMLILLPNLLKRTGLVNYVYRDIQGHLAESFVGGAMVESESDASNRENQHLKQELAPSENHEVELPVHSHDA